MEIKEETKATFHVIAILRSYLGLSQTQLGKLAGLSQCDISEMENRPPYGWVSKYQRLSQFLDVPIEALAKNDYTLVPESFFDSHPHPDYSPTPTSPDHKLGRDGEEFIFAREQKRLNQKYPALAKLVLPYFKMRTPSPGYDILSFDDEGTPFCLEVKNSTLITNSFRLTKKELTTAKKMTEVGGRYVICYISGWETPNQTVREYNFKDLELTHKIQPLFYQCTPKMKPTMISGLMYHRQLCGLRQEDVAEALNIMQCDLSLYETGQRKASIDFYLRASKLLDVSVDELLAEYEGTVTRIREERG